MHGENDDMDGENDGMEAIYSEFHTVTLADLYMAQGHFERARAVLDDILSRDPKNEEAVKKLAEISKIMTLSDKVFGSPAAPEKAPLDNGPLIASLEGWLSRISHRTGLNL
jgi:hypothetical protein